MISPETQTSPLLRRTANLLKSFAEASSTSDIPPLATWSIHRIGTGAHLAQRNVLDLLGRPGVTAKAQADLDTRLDASAAGNR
jgi:hypothetical protein